MVISWELFAGPLGGVLLAFAITRSYDLWKNRREKRKLLQSLKRELNDCFDRLNGKARLVPIDIWHSTIASGKAMLLSSEQLEKLGRIYHGLSNHNFDSKKLWNVSVIAKTEKDAGTDTPAKLTWFALSEHLAKAEKVLKASVTRLLEEKWWHDL